MGQFRQKISCVIITAFLGLAVGGGQAADPTPQQLADAILEQAACDLQTLDLNGDGVCDVADIVCLQSECFRRASFQLSQQTLDETAGTVQIVVELAAPVAVQTTLNISVDPTSTATVNADYAPIASTATVAMNQSSAMISVTILDDADVDEQIETLSLIIEPGSGYQIGTNSRHTIILTDDDSTWNGMLETGTGLGRYPLTMVITSDGDLAESVAAQLISDGFGSFPAGSWAVSDIEFVVSQTPGTSSFEATVEPITMLPGTTSAGQQFTRSLSFDAHDAGRFCEDGLTPCSSHTVCGPSSSCLPAESSVSRAQIWGTFVESVSFPDAPHLNREVQGTFMIGRTVQPGPIAPLPQLPQP